MDLGWGESHNLFVHFLNVATLNKPPFPAFCYHFGYFDWLEEDG